MQIIDNPPVLLKRKARLCEKGNETFQTYSNYYGQGVNFPALADLNMLHYLLLLLCVVILYIYSSHQGDLHEPAPT
jgi:hypothetical protein